MIEGFCANERKVSINLSIMNIWAKKFPRKKKKIIKETKAYFLSLSADSVSSLTKMNFKMGHFGELKEYIKSADF